MKTYSSKNKIIVRRKQAKLKYIQTLQCHIHDDVEKENKGFIRENVCVKSQDYPLTKFEDGKYYCLFHLPTQEKDIDEFERIFKSKLLEIDSLNKNESLIEGTKESKEISYNFQYIWFPSHIDLGGQEFKAAVFFRNATFARGVNFGIAKFRHQVQFHKAKFLGVAIFDNARFCDGAYFLECIFSANTYFGDSKFYKSKPSSRVSFEGTIFHKEARFYNSRFFVKASFKEVLFEGNTYFSKAKFKNTVSDNEENIALFSYTKFYKDTYFDETEFHNGVSFNSAVFGNDSDLIFRQTLFEEYVSFRYSAVEGYLRFLDLKQGTTNHFNFQEAATEEASRISFNNVRLQPNWFINVDSRNIVFININEEFASANVKNEINILRKNDVNNASHHLKVTCRQLAENAENNNRFEESSKFRRMAFEIERVEKREKRKKWIADLGKLVRKEILCSKFFSEFNIQSRKIVTHFRVFTPDISSSLYRFTSRYGESWGRAAFVLLIAVLVVFPIIYSLTQFQVSPKGIPLEVMVLNKCEITDEERKNGKEELVKESKDVCHSIEQRGLGLFNGEAILHSLTTITFQDVEYRRPLSFYAEFWTALEKILVPLQAALLALAIRRKFMR